MYPYSGIPAPDGLKREVLFRNGYGIDRPEFVALCTLEDIRGGREEWGAVPGEEYYVLRIHEITEKRNLKDSVTKGAKK